MAKRKRSMLRRNSWFFLIVFIISILIGVVLFSQEAKMMELKRELRDQRKHRAELLGVMQMLEQKVNALDTNASKESLAREKLNMIRADEIMYIIKYKSDEDK